MRSAEKACVGSAELCEALTDSEVPSTSTKHFRWRHASLSLPSPRSPAPSSSRARSRRGRLTPPPRTAPSMALTVDAFPKITNSEIGDF